MEKYFQFQLRPEASSPPMFQLVNMSNVKYLWATGGTKLVFVSNDFNPGGDLVLTGSVEDSAGYIKAYLEREWQQLINSNDKIRVIPSILPVTIPGEGEQCELNDWESYDLIPAFGEGPEGCLTILSVDVNPEGLGNITIGSTLEVEGVFGYYAIATGTRCGTQEIAFITGIDCGMKGDVVGLPGLEDYLFTGKKIFCENEGGESTVYCLIAKPVFTEGAPTTPTISFGMEKINVG